MIKVCPASTTRKSVISSSRALFTETLPSSSPGMKGENHGSEVLFPVMIPTVASILFRVFGRLSASVPSCCPAGPIIN